MRRRQEYLWSSGKDFVFLWKDLGSRRQSCEVLASLVPVVTGDLVVRYFHKYKQSFLVLIWLKNSPCTHMHVKPKPSLYTHASET